MPGAASQRWASSAGPSSTSTLSGSPIRNRRSAVRASNALSRDTRAVIWARAIRTGSTRASARGVGRMPSEPSGQELVAEQRAQAGEVVAHGRLAKADAGGGARDAALGEQRVESDEQVQVDAAQIDVVDGHYRSDLFDR